MAKPLILLLFFVAACTEVAIAPPPGPPGGSANAPLPLRSEAAARSSFQRSVVQVEPAAEQVCRELNPDFPPIACDFSFSLSNETRLGANAFQTIERNGQPKVVFTMLLLRQLTNDDEVAFILGHEASHQVARHIFKTVAQERLGAALLSSIAATSAQATQASVNRAASLGALIGSRAYSKQFEIEADVLATYITERAGFDPVAGAEPFGRFETGSTGFLATHPPSAQRMQKVRETAANIRRQRARGRVPTLPQF